ncbi:MAG: hypothetical protein NZM18_01665 [Thermoflexales bacterium]|nr:hypothetical protein [Thermoflexales bacterium]MDW8350804.1 hypothetical protein [Anaerolineae bacterium]
MTIVQLFNQYSFFLLPVVILLATAVALIRRRARAVFWVAWAAVLVGFVAYGLFSRVPQTIGVKLDTAADIRAAIQTAGRPTLVQIYSNY